MRRLFVAALAAACFMSYAHAQSNAPGPFVTSSGTLLFMRAGRAFTAMLDSGTFDRFAASRLTHFDDIDDANHAVARTLVETDAGPVLYDFRRHPPLVQRSGKRMTVERVFWQRDEVVLQGSEGWFRFKGGVLSKLQSSKTTYH